MSLLVQSLIIQPGQVYINNDINEYLVVTKSERGHISYVGKNFKGMQEAEDFIMRFKPVDPKLLSREEFSQLQNMSAHVLKVGFIAKFSSDGNLDVEEDEEI